MKNEDETKEQFVNELAELRRCVTELEKTEHTWAKKELRESEERYRNFCNRKSIYLDRSSLPSQ